MWWSKAAKPCRSVKGPSRRRGHESRNRGLIKPACGGFAWSGVVLCVFLLVFGRCGYKVQPVGRPVGIDIQSLAIPIVESTSSLAGFEGDFTRMIRQEFVSHSSVPLVSREEAQMVLLGRIHTIKTDPLGYSLAVSRDYPVTSSRWLIMRLEAKLVDRHTGKTIWTEKDLEEKASYQVGQDPLVNRHNERRAIEEIAGRLAKRIYLKTMERF
jgi:Lipopolysaccharide-assembly